MEQQLKDKLVSLELLLLKKETRASKVELERLIADYFLEIAAMGIRFGKLEAIERLPTEVFPEFTSTDLKSESFQIQFSRLPTKQQLKDRNKVLFIILYGVLFGD